MATEHKDTSTIAADKVEHMLSLLAKVEGDSLDTWYDSSTGNYDLRSTPGSKVDTLTSLDGSKTLGLCNLATVSLFSIPFEDSLDPMLHGIHTTPTNSTKSIENPSHVAFAAGYEYAFATYLAILHVNTGNGSIVKELEGLNETCSIRFVPEFFDTQANPQVTMGVVNNILSRRRTEQDSFPVDNQQTEPPKAIPPCAFIGSWASLLTEIVALQTGRLNYPQVSPHSILQNLDDKTFYPRFARTIPAQSGQAHAFVEFLLQNDAFMQNPYLAVLHVDSDYANAFATRVREAISDYNLQKEEADPWVYVSSVSLNPSGKDIERQISQLKLLEFQTFFAILPYIEKGFHHAVMKEAYDQNVAGNGETVWYFSEDSFEPILLSNYHKDSVLTQVYSGAGLIFPGTPVGEVYGDFAKQMQEMKSSNETMSFMLDMVPSPPGDLNHDYSTIIQSSEFLDPSYMDPRVQFAYEATVLLGLAACNGSNKAFDLNGTSFYEHVLETSFKGISGNMHLDQITGSRVATSSSYSIMNLLYEDQEEGFSVTPANIMQNGTWKNIPNISFVYNGGIAAAPVARSDFSRWRSSMHPENLYLDTWVVVSLSILCAVAILLSLCCGGWTVYKRNSRIVRASQPRFLLLMCLGSIILASSIIPISLDLSLLSVEGMQAGCNATVWLLFIGNSLTLSSFWAKTRRVNTIMNNAKKYRRITVTLKETLIPVALSVSVNILLLSFMVAFRPIGYTFYADTTNVDQFGRPEEFFAHCDHSKSWGFLGPLICIAFVTLLRSLYEAWRARNLSTEFQETESIFRALFVVLLAGFVGIPVIVLVKDNTNARVFLASIIIFVTCVAIQLLIFVPKIQYERMRKSGSNVKISGLDCESPVASNAQLDPMAALSRLSNHEGECFVENGGERILSSKTRQQLAEEVALLKKRLQELEEPDEQVAPTDDSIDE